MKTSKQKTRLRELSEEFERLERKLKLGGGAAKIEKIHQKGKLTARERIDLLFDKDTYQQEIGLLVAYDEYNGQAPAAAVVTSVGKIHGRECVVVANDATIKGGRVVSGNDQENSSRTGNCDALPRADHLSG